MSVPMSVSPEYIKVKNKLRSLQTQLSYPAVYNFKNGQLNSGHCIISHLPFNLPLVTQVPYVSHILERIRNEK